MFLAQMICFSIVTMLSAGATADAGQEIDVPDVGLRLRGLEQVVAEQETRPRRWFVLVGLVNVYPRLEREKLIKDILDPALSVLAPTYRGTRTFTDMRDEGLLWPPQIAVGKVLSTHFALSIHGGYSEGAVRTKKSNPSILLGLPLYSDIKIRRYATYVGIDLDYYPWGMVESKQYPNWAARFRAARPTLGVRHTWTWAGYDASIRLGLWPLKHLVAIRLKDNWALPNITFVAGVDVPLNTRSTLIINVGYSFFRREKQDFNGPAITLGWRYMF